jgi:cytochrome o ubiquinol oxidase operon protein cyoD
MSPVTGSTVESDERVVPHGAHDSHGDDGGHGTLRGYVTGFVLSVILTAIPFWLVMSNALKSSGLTITVVLAFAVVQIVVHAVYFLHMNTKAQGGWMVMALIFTLTLVLITLSGSIWIMYHLNSNMMSMSPDEMIHRQP